MAVIVVPTQHVIFPINNHKGGLMPKIILFLLMLCLSVTTFAKTNYDEYDGAPDRKNQTFHLYDDIDMITDVKFKYEKPRMTIKSVYPRLESESMSDGVTSFNQLVLDLIQNESTQFINRVLENKEAISHLPKSAKNNLYIDYSASLIKYGKQHLLSVRFNIQGFIAGLAHPYHYHKVLNFNLDADKTIALSDLFDPDAQYLKTLSEYSRSVLYRRLTNREMIDSGTTPTEEHFQNWNIKPNGLLMTFDEYQVAPYVSGAQTILIPFSELTDIVTPDSPIAYCINHPKRCRNNNLLTGGFIDEAVNTRNRSLNPILGKI
jgi:hypothetical protein